MSMVLWRIDKIISKYAMLHMASLWCHMMVLTYVLFMRFEQRLNGLWLSCNGWISSYMRSTKYIWLMSLVKCICGDFLNLMCLVYGYTIGTHGVNSNIGCYSPIALVEVGVVLGYGSYVKVMFHGMLYTYECICLN